MPKTSGLALFSKQSTKPISDSFHKQISPMISAKQELSADNLSNLLSESANKSGLNTSNPNKSGQSKTNVTGGGLSDIVKR